MNRCKIVPEMNNSSLWSGTTWIAVMNYTGVITGLLHFSVVARVLQHSDLGGLSFLSMLSLLFIIVGTLALPKAAVKFIAEYDTNQEERIAKGFLKAVLGIALLCALLAGIILCYSADYISVMWLESSSLHHLIELFSFNVALVVLREFLRRTLQGYRALKSVGCAGVLGHVLRTASSLFFIFLGFGLTGVVMGWLVGDLLESTILLRFLLVHLDRRTPMVFPTRQVFNFAFPLYISGILAYFSATIDRYLVLTIGGSSLLG